MQLLLLLELEHLRRPHREHVLDVVEDGVVVLDVERAAHVQRRAESLGEFQRDLHRPIAVGGTVDTDHEAAAVQRRVVPNDQQILLHLPRHPRHHPPELRIVLPADAVRAHHHEVVGATRRSGQLLLTVLFTHDPPVVAQPNVRSDPLAAVVVCGNVGVEPDERRELTLSAVHLLHDLLEIDALEQLTTERHTRARAPLFHLIEE